MVRLLAELPPELRVHVADMCAASTAGQLAQTDRACAALCSTRLAVLWAAHVQALSNAAALELQLAFAARNTSAALMAMDDMGGGQLALRVVSREAPLRAQTTTFSCECCQGGRTWQCGGSFSNVMRHLASKQHWTSHRDRVHNLPFNDAAWRSFAASLCP